MAGLLGGLFGVGGGFLVIPLLGFFYGMDQQTAQGTVLIMVVPNVVWAFSRYRRRFGVDLRMAATIAGSALIGLSNSPFGDWPRPACPTARLRSLSRHDCRDRRLPHVARRVEGWSRADASLGVDNSRRPYRWLLLRLLRSRWGLCCAPAIDDVLRITAVGGARSGAGARCPQRTYRITGLCRSR